MGWFEDPDASEPAVQDALRIAKAKSLPVAVRSCTRAEYLGRFRKIALIGLAGYVLFGGIVLLGLVLEGGAENRMMVAIVVPTIATGALFIWLVMRWRMRRSGKYRDPGIAVEVGADGIIVRGSGGAYGMRWHEIEARPIWVPIKSGIHFIGLWLQSPLGWVQLTEEYYRQGRIAAAQIVRGMHDDYHARQKVRVERIG